MPEESDQAAVDKRATWVALRTVRQRPKVVDYQKNGEPIYEIRSVRLVLRDNVDHFNRLAQCSKCGRELPGAPVLTQADLTRPSHSVLCKECVRKATDRAQRPLQARQGEVQTAKVAKNPEGITPGVGAPAQKGQGTQDDGRLAVIESRLADVLMQLEALADAQQHEHDERRKAVDDVEGRMHEALVRGLDSSAGIGSQRTGGGSKVDALESRVQESLARLVNVTQDQQRDLASVTAALAETRSELQRVVESNRNLALVQQDADQRLVKVTTLLGAQPTTSDVANALRGEIAEAEARMAGEAASDRAELQQAIREGLALVRQEVASLEKQLLASAEARPQGVEAQRTQTGGGTVVGARIEQQLATVAEAVRQLTRAGDELERTVGGLLDNAQKTEMRVSALSSLADAGARRLHTLEQGISEALNRLTVPAAEGTKELGRAMPGDTSTTRWADGAPVSMTLLDAIDRQLRDAEIRLALRSSRPYPD